MTKEGITNIVRKCGHDVLIRGEKLSIDEFARLSEFFTANQKSFDFPC